MREFDTIFDTCEIYNCKHVTWNSDSAQGYFKQDDVNDYFIYTHSLVLRHWFFNFIQWILFPFLAAGRRSVGGAPTIS